MRSNSSIDNIQSFVMSSFQGSAFIGDALDKDWIFLNIKSLDLNVFNIEDRISVAINELVLNGFLDKKHNITELGVSVFCPIRRSSIKSCFISFLRQIEARENDCLDSVINDFSKSYAEKKIIWGKRELDYFHMILIPELIEFDYIEIKGGCLFMTKIGFSAFY